MQLTIITTVLNGENSIRDCLESVRKQSIIPEQIIIDGGSKDRTLNIVDEYRDGIARLISEKDDGIYDGMNKGLKLAAGDIIGILNADDVYAHDKVLSMVTSAFNDDNVDSCYGDLVYVEDKNTEKIIRKWKAWSFDTRRFYWGWMPPHPTFFVRRSVYEKYGLFNLDLGSAADYELMLRFLLKHRISTAYIPEVLVKMRSGGASNASLKKRLIANRMDRKAWEVNGLKPYPWTIPLKPLRKIPQYLVFG
jgi:glycosyltransferase involved in cell wall biosynthesis